MAFIPSTKHVDELYDKYSKVEVTFTQDVCKTLKLACQQISFRYKNGHRSCVLCSSSLTVAKITSSLPDHLVKILQKNNTISLRYSFFKENTNEDFFSFFVHSHITDLTQYDRKKKLYLAQLTFLHKPTNELIYIIGSLLDTRKSAIIRKDKRIIIDTRSLRDLGIVSAKVQISFNNIPREGFLRDLSFEGMKMIVWGDPKPMMNQDVTIFLDMDAGNSIRATGKMMRTEPIAEHEELQTIVLQLHERTLPLQYKMMINNYLAHYNR